MFRRIFLLICIVALLFGCGDDQKTAAPQPRGYLYIGLVAPLEGPLANLGRDMIRGAEMAVDDANRARKEKDRRFKLLIRDETKDKAPERRLASDPRVAVTVGFAMEKSLQKAREIYAQAPMPLILPLLSGPQIVESNPFYSLMPSDKDQAEALGGYTASKLQAKSVLVVYEDSEFGRTTSQAFTKAIGSTSGIQVIKAPFPENPDELLSLAEKAAARKPDVVFPAVHARAAIYLTQALNRAGLKTNLVGTSALALNEAALILERLTVKTYLTLPFDPVSPGPRAAEFIAGYGRKNHRPPNWPAFLSYEAVSLAVKAVSLAGDQAGEVDKYLSGLNSPASAFEGLAGNYYFTADGQGVGPIYILPAGQELVDRLP